MAFTPFVETDQPTMANFNEKFQEAIQAAIDGGTQVSTGSYVGTGAYGSTNKNSVTLDFSPLFFCVGITNGEDTLGMIWWSGLTKIEVGTSAVSTTNIISVSGKTISWYCTGTAYSQLNESGKKYYYFAIGQKEE